MNSLNKRSKSLLGSLSLQQKTLLLFVGATFIIVLVIVLYIATSTSKNAIDEAIAQMGVTTDKYADKIKSNLENDLYIARTLSGIAQNYKSKPMSEISENLIGAYEKALPIDPNIISIWDSWELSYVDKNYTKNHGRIRNIVWHEGNSLNTLIDTLDLDGDSQDYARMKRDGTECLEEPYFDSYDNSGKQILMTSIIVPNYFDSKLAGFIGVDIPLEHFYTLIQQIRPYKNSYAFLVSNSFKYIAHPNPDLIGKDAHEQYGDIFESNGALDRITSGNAAFFETTDYYGKESYFTVRPITLGNSQMSWALVIVVPKATIVRASFHSFITALLLGLLGITAIGFWIYFALRKYVIKPISLVTKSLEQMAKGEIDENANEAAEISSNDEIGQMTRYLAQTVEGLSKKVVFSKEIGAHNYNATLDLLSEDDELGQSLIDMGRGLLNAQNDEIKRKSEDENRQWINEGLAKFSAILRQDNDNIQQLASNITCRLVDYLQANQGGLFLLNNDDEAEPSLDLLASYAYNRQKFIQKSILVGEGLVGVCAIEKQTIHLTNIPENYITISSGLGEAKPRSLIIVPLLVDDEILGVIELASFNDFEPFQIDFVEKVAQSIAQTLVTVRTTIQTKDLLSRSQQQAEEMKAQEEEVRQNLEELETIKEELEKRNDEFVENQKNLEWEKSLLDSLLNYLPDRIYFKDLQSKFIKISKSTLSAFSLENEEDLIGKSDFDFFDDEHARPAFNDEQRIIRTNTPIIGVLEKEVFADGSVTWSETSKLPLKLPNGEIIGTFGISRDVTNSKELEQKVKQQEENAKQIMQSVELAEKERQDLFDAVTNSTFVIEYTPDGVVSYVNDAYLNLYGLKRDQIMGTHHSQNMEFTDEQRNDYNQFWSDLNNGAVKRQTNKFVVGEKHYIFHETYSPIKDADGNVYKIIKIAINVTNLE